MIHNNIIKGNLINLCPVTEMDAEFILSLRLNDKLNKYIHNTDPCIEKQKSWITQQQHRQGDYYFVIYDNLNNKTGVISLYDIKEKQGEFGRWIVNGNPLFSLESAILIYDFGFNVLKLDRIITRTVEDNVKVVEFHKKFGTDFVKREADNQNPEFTFYIAEIKKEKFEEIKEKNYSIIRRFL